MLVMKFGGTSVGTADSIKEVVGIIRDYKDKKPLVVVSALSKVTDMLIEAAKMAVNGEVSVDDIRERHLDVIKRLELDAAILEPELKELGHALTGVSYVKKLMPELYAVVVSFGERMSSKIIAAYARSAGLNAAAYNAFDLGLKTDSNYEEAEVLPESYSLIPVSVGNIGQDEVPIVTGFIAKDSSGSITTLGRGGSDYTASIFAAALNAEEVQIWTDVDGILSADPKIVPSAKTIKEISFSEAAELAFFGARVLHPKTVTPALNKNIPVRILNTFNRSSSGTVIVKVKNENDSELITAIACKRSISAINISSPKMLLAYGFMKKIFDAFARNKISVDVVSTSEVSVSITVDAKYGLTGLLKELNALGAVNVAYDKASVSLVGSGLKNTPGIAGIIFGTLGEAGINVEMISMGASEINISFIVEEKNVEKAVKLLHKAFFDMSETLKHKPFASAGGKQASVSESQKPSVSDDARKLKLPTHAQEHAPGFSPGVLDKTIKTGKLSQNKSWRMI